MVGPLTAATPPIRTASPVITGSQIPPPPAHLLPLLPRFYILLHGYLALDGASKLSFPAWVFLNGVTDPVVLAGMSELYEWYLSGSSHRARRDR
ncbi:MAG TPA: hypothetical protein PKC43_10915 [Phycisphaerales bacterium]|nr:hypothetical protein [Phycisphaerales bacterium]HMP37944.1 hypothetical protein [Phycisphaerales bacterium]